MNFEDWFYETEVYSLRAERFYEELMSYHSDLVGDQNIVRWLRAAYEVGKEHGKAE